MEGDKGKELITAKHKLERVRPATVEVSLESDVATTVEQVQDSDVPIAVKPMRYKARRLRALTRAIQLVSDMEGDKRKELVTAKDKLERMRPATVEVSLESDVATTVEQVQDSDVPIAVKPMRYKARRLRALTRAIQLESNMELLQSQYDDMEKENMRLKDQINVIRLEYDMEREKRNEMITTKDTLESDLKLLQSHYDDIQKERICLKDQINAIQLDCEMERENSKEMSNRIIEITTQQESQISMIRLECDTEREKKHEQIAANGKLECNLKLLQSQYDDMQKERICLKDQINVIRLECDTEREKKHEHIAANGKLERNLKLLRSQYDDMQKERMCLKDQINAIQLDCEMERENSKEMSKRIIEITTQQESLSFSIFAAKEENEIMRQQNKMEKHNFEKVLEEKDHKIHTMDELITSLQTTITRQKGEIENIYKMHVALKEELHTMESKRILQVQLYCRNRTSLARSVEQELSKLLKRRMESEKLELEFVQCAKPSDFQDGLPMLLLCSSVSSRETDVAHVLQGLTLHRKMAVLIFHHKEAHALPNQSSERVLTRPDLGNLGGIYDMAFLFEKGIYDCEMNNNNVVSVTNFINREGVE